MFTVITRSIILNGSKIAKPGDVLTASDFKGKEKQLAILLEKGVLVRGKGTVPNNGLTVDRAGGDLLPALPTEADPKGGRVLSRRFKLNDANNASAKAKLDAIKAAQQEREEVEGEEPVVAPPKPAPKRAKPLNRSGASAAELLTAEERAALMAQFEGQELSPEDMRKLGLIV